MSCLQNYFSAFELRGFFNRGKTLLLLVVSKGFVFDFHAVYYVRGGGACKIFLKKKILRVTVAYVYYFAFFALSLDVFKQINLHAACLLLFFLNYFNSNRIKSKALTNTKRGKRKEDFDYERSKNQVQGQGLQVQFSRLQLRFGINHRCTRKRLPYGSFLRRLLQKRELLKFYLKGRRYSALFT